MNVLKITLWSLSILLFLFLITSIGFLWWNHYPPLPLEGKAPIYHLKIDKSFVPPKYLKIASYNIHFGIGLDWERKDRLDKKSFYARLDNIANILKNIDADIVLLQEVDFIASRSQEINQATYLAEKAEYPYVATATQIKEKFHPSIQGLHGKINHGICILSRYKITENVSKIFTFPNEMPFYLRWLYSPHGAQKVSIQIGKTLINVVNLHLEPWCQKTRENQAKEIKSWIQEITVPIVLGGDLNTIPPETPDKKHYYLSDTPWFINRNNWDLNKDDTIAVLRSIKKISEAISSSEYLKDLRSAYTYPADNPKEKLDYLFALNNCKIFHGFVYKNAKEASDHLPIVAFLKY